MREYLLIFLAGMAAAIVACTVVYDGKMAKQAATYADEKRELAEDHTEALRKQQAESVELGQRLEKLDSTKTKELTNAQANNDRLRGLYSVADTERKRLRIEVRTARDNTVPTTPGTCSVGDVNGVELSDSAGSAVWDLRASMIEDHGKIAYLQGYVCSLRPDLAVCVAQ